MFPINPPFALRASVLVGLFISTFDTTFSICIAWCIAPTIPPFSVVETVNVP